MLSDFLINKAGMLRRLQSTLVSSILGLVAEIIGYIATRSTKERTYIRYMNGHKHTVKPFLGEKAAHNNTVVYMMDFQATPHQLRHTYITNLIYTMADPKTVQHLAGHQNCTVSL